MPIVNSLLLSEMKRRPSKRQIWTVESSKSAFSDISKTSLKTGCGSLWVLDTLKAYCGSTGLHGLNHVIRPDTTRNEKIGWIIVVFLAMIVCLVLLVISYNWNAESRTVTVIESTHHATWNVPFPAVTICNFNKISKTLAMNQASVMKRPNNVTVEQLANMFLLTLDFGEAVERPPEEYAQLSAILKENGLNINMLQALLVPPCRDMVLRCMWKGLQTRCDSLFQRVNTTFGICCSFNYYGMSRSNYRAQVAHTIPKLPRRVTASGYQTGLTAILEQKNEDYFGTFLSAYGFRVYIHDSYDYPDPNAEIKIVSPKTENFISITPESTYATEDVRRLHPVSRDCLFRAEKKLRTMQRYSYVNCLAECRAQLFYRTCGCIPHGYLNNGSFPPCPMEQTPCVLEHMASFTAALPGLNLTVARQKGTFKSVCDCLPDCELNQYPAEIATGILDRTYSFNGLNFFKDLEIDDQIIVHVYFNDLISSRYRKDIFQNWIGLLASFGGLLGLIIGFSIVTAFEFVYYFTLRPLFAFITAEVEKRQNKIHVEDFNNSKMSIIKKWNTKETNVTKA